MANDSNPRTRSNLFEIFHKIQMHSSRQLINGPSANTACLLQPASYHFYFQIGIQFPDLDCFSNCLSFSISYQPIISNVRHICSRQERIKFAICQNSWVNRDWNCPIVHWGTGCVRHYRTWALPNPELPAQLEAYHLTFYVELTPEISKIVLWQSWDFSRN